MPPVPFRKCNTIADSTAICPYMDERQNAGNGVLCTVYVLIIALDEHRTWLHGKLRNAQWGGAFAIVV